MYKVYILKSEVDGSLYVGFTKDLNKRLKDHSNGTTKSTKAKLPYKLIWYCVFGNKLKAMQFERYMKQGSGFTFARKHFV